MTIFCFDICDQTVGLLHVITANQPKTDLSGFPCQAEWQAENWSNQLCFENSRLK